MLSRLFVRRNKIMKIAIILGTRPEIIKMSSVIRECQKRKIDFFIIHTNQHYSLELDAIFFQELNLPAPTYNLGIGSGKHGEITGKMLIAIEKVLADEKPDLVLAQGDTNTVLAGSLAAVKLDIPIGHIEAGLRSYDQTMPEETNRKVVDHISKYLFVPTKNAAKNLIKEGISKQSILIVGNTIVDTLYRNIKVVASKQSTILGTLNLTPKKYILATIHRQENVDNRERLENILKGLKKTVVKLKIPIIVPAHPRLVKMINAFGLKLKKNITLINPLGYLDFLTLEKNARLIITDSGGVQEEACILQTPCMTIRDNTERPETIDVGANVLVGTNPNKIFSTAIDTTRVKKWKNPFGKGDSGKKIIGFLIKEKKYGKL